jgi:type IV secretion system protein TrbL
MTTAQGYAKHIFASLAVLDLGWWGIKNVLKKNDLTDFIGGATLKISSIFFFYTIVSYAPTWMPLITSSFMQMGQGIGGAGAGATTPSGIMSEAFSVISTLWTTVQANTGWDHLGNSVLFALVAVVTSVFGLIGFGLVALQLFMTQIEMYLVGGAGVVMLGFTGSSMTSSFGEKYIGYMISIGIKLLVIYAIVGLGQNVINSEIAYINAWTSATPPLDLLSVGATMLIYGVIGMQVPGMAGSLMNGSPNMSLGNVAGGAAAIAGGVAAAGAAAVAGAAGAAQGLAKMADLVGAGVNGAGGAAGGIGGADSLGALSSMTGPASGAGATSAGIGDATGAASQSAGAGSTAAPSAASAPASAPASGTTDALGAGTQSGSGTAGTGSEEAASQDKNHWKAMGDQLGKLADKKDDIARHEGSTGGGIQIRLNHTE